MEVRDRIPDDAKEIEGVETLRLNSVGIDIGSSTSHLTFSTLVARRKSGEVSSRFEITDKEQVYASDIRLTPYVEGNTIDVDELDAFITAAYEEAGFEHGEIDTGAVIVTGEAAKKKNAESIANIFSERAGKFVTASAGPTLEAIMAAHGSGSVEISEGVEGRVMNLDVGGGTSKVTVIENGEVLETSSVNVGARLVATDEAGIIERAEPTARTVARMADLDLALEVGEPLEEAGKELLAETLADVLFEFVTTPAAEQSALTRELTISALDTYLDDVAAITFSGGCSEFIYGVEKHDFGDLGAHLGAAVRERFDASGVPVERTKQGIRATVVGSTQYSVQISGNTIHASDESLLPIRNYQVVPVEMDIDEERGSIRERIEAHLETFELDALAQDFALAFAVDGTVPTLDTMQTIADVASETFAEHGAGPALVILDIDLAQSVGRHLEERMSGRGVVVVDGIDVGSLEYVDVGSPLQDSRAVPVIVKSLVFGGRPE